MEGEKMKKKYVVELTNGHGGGFIAHVEAESEFEAIQRARQQTPDGFNPNLMVKQIRER